MRNVPGWVVGAAGAGVVAAAFFLGGRLAASDVTPALTMAAPVSYVQRAGDVPPAVIRRTPAPRSASVQRVSTVRKPAVKKRSTRRSVVIIAGSTAAGAVIGGVAKGKKGAVIGGIVGGAAATIWDQVTRRRSSPDR